MFLQKYLIGFKLSLWLGHSRTFRVICKPLLLCLGSLSCWKVIRLPCLGFWMLWTRFLLWHYIISIFWSVELYFWSDESLSPCRWQTAPQHCYKHTLFWDGTLNEAECVFSELFPRCVASRKPVSDAVLLTSGLDFCSEMHYQLLNLLLKCVCLSKSHLFDWICHRLTSTNNMNAPELDFSCPG